MASYWIVVPQGNAELFDLLSMAFKGRTGFSVIMDRRTSGASAPGADRRSRSDSLGPDEIVVAERADKSENRATRARAAGHRRGTRRLPREAESSMRRAHTAPLPARAGHRLFSL